MSVRVTLLGGCRVTDERGDAVKLPTRKARALLAYLAVAPGTPHARDTLAALLWGGATDDRARNSLRQCVFTLRRALAPPGGSRADPIRQQDETIWLDPHRVHVDVVELERLLADGSRAALERAEGLYRGELLRGLAVAEAEFEDWLVRERQRLQELAIEGLARLLAVQAGAGAGQEAIRTATRLLRLDPLREAIHRTLMRLYAQRGRRSEALRQYQTLTELLARELGVEPEAETERLRREILELRLPTAPRRGGSHGADGPEASARGGPPRILIVEDEASTRALLERLLASAGYDVRIAADGEAALRHMGQEHFDLVLSDVSMPSVDGFTLLEAMRGEGHATPIVFLTAAAAAEDEIRGLSLGASDYIRKPISRDVLLLRVENVLRRQP